MALTNLESRSNYFLVHYYDPREMLLLMCPIGTQWGEPAMGEFMYVEGNICLTEKK